MPLMPAILLLLLILWNTTAGALTLTDEEKAWLAAHQQLSLGVDASWPPFEFRDQEGRYQGLAADYIAAIQQRLGVTLKPVEPSSWTEVLAQARENRIDLLPGIMSTPNAKATWPSPARTSTSPSSSSPTKAAHNRANWTTCTA